MTWLARLKKTAIAPYPDPTKPTKPLFVGFVGTPAGLSQKSGVDATAANDPTQAQDFDREAFEERAAIMEFDGGLSRIEAERLALTDGANLRKPEGEATDPDRHSWPHTTAMNTAEIDAFNARVHLFTRRGIDTTQAEGLVDGLVIRDRDGDDRRLCLECLHLSGGRPRTCNQWRSAGLGGAGVPADMVTLLQRCGGFKEMTR